MANFLSKYLQLNAYLKPISFEPKGHLIRSNRSMMSVLFSEHGLEKLDLLIYLRVMICYQSSA